MRKAISSDWRDRPDIVRYRTTLCKWLPINKLKGLEIGPLDKPLVEPEHGRISYIDQFPLDELRRRCAANPNRDQDALVPLDYVLNERAISDVVPQGFDYVVASHVAEHIPNLFGWLGELGGLLNAPSWIFLVIPDRHYTFDIGRPATTLGQLVENQLINRTRPGMAAAFDQRFYHKGVVSHDIWSGAQNPVTVPNTFAPEQALERAYQAQSEYVDCHCNVFDPNSFQENIEASNRLGLQPFRCREIRLTERPFLDFIVLLEKNGS